MLFGFFCFWRFIGGVESKIIIIKFNVSNFYLFSFSLLFARALRLIVCLYAFAGKEIILEWELIQVCGVKISFILIVDYIRTIFFSTVILIAGRVFLYRRRYIMLDGVSNRFIWLVFTFVVRICLLIFRPNIISLLLGWDGLGVTSYLLVNYYSSEKRFNARILTALTNRLGDIFILVFIGMSTTPSVFNIFTHSSAAGLESGFILLVLLAAITKRAQIPFSAWLPAAIAAPTPVSALVHSSTLVTAGVYLLLRFNLLLMCNIWAILILGCMTIIIAGVSGLTELDIKKIIALSTLRQLGVIFFRVGLGEVFLAYFHLISHAYFKAIIFMCAGAIIHRMSDYQDLRKMGGGSSSNPFIISVLFIGSIRLCGLPFTSGFYSKDQILEVIIMSDLSLLAVVFTCVATIITAIYSCRVVLKLFFMTYGGIRINSMRDSNKELIWGNSLLLFPAIMGGYWLKGFVGGSVIVSLSLWIKLIILRLVLFSRVLCFFQPVSFMFKNTISSFLNQMWFLPWTFSVYMTNVSTKYRKSVIKICDKSWMSWILIHWIMNHTSTNYIVRRVSSILMSRYLLIILIALLGLFTGWV